MSPRSLRHPRQARSIRTLDRLLASASRLLEGEDFSRLSVARIAAGAGVTIGAFYARFAGKGALLDELERRMAEDFSTLAEGVEALAGLRGPALERGLTAYHRRLVGVYRAHRGVCRALVVQSHSDPRLRARLDRINAANLPRVARALASGDGSGTEARVRFGLLAVRSLCRELVVFGEGWPGGGKPDDDRLARELTALLLAYLRTTGDELPE